MDVMGGKSTINLKETEKEETHTHQK